LHKQQLAIYIPLEVASSQSISEAQLPAKQNREANILHKMAEKPFRVKAFADDDEGRDRLMPASQPTNQHPRKRDL